MRITTGKIPGPQKVLVYGPEGIGKSTLAAMFPDPLFIDTEGSTKHMDVKRLDPPSSWTMLKQQVQWVRDNRGVCATLVIDTTDWAEQLCISHVCSKAQVGGIEDFGYGKGYTYLAEEFGSLLNLLTEVIATGVHVVLTAHAQIRKFEQPDETAAYDRWELKLQKKTAPLVKEWADMVLFANYKTFAVKDSKSQKVTPQGGKRVILTSHRPAWDAKNRHNLPEEIQLEENVFPKELAAAIAFERVQPAVAETPAPAPETKAAPAETKAPAAETTTPIADAIAEEFAAEGGALGECEVCGLSGGAHQEGCDNASPKAPDNVVPLKTQDAPGSVAIPAHLKALYDLMASAGVTVPEVQRAVAHRGYFPERTPIEKYPEDFVKAVLVGAWPQVLGIIAELKHIPF